jgi:hypothetical protein
MHRFFRTDEQTYEAIRSQLDAAWGHPSAVVATCVEPAATAPRDADGLVMVAVHAEFCEYSVAVDLLPQLLASGVVEEIDRETYIAALPSE